MSVGVKLTEKKLSKNVRNHQVMYTVTTIGKSTAQPPKNFLDSQLPNTLCRACILLAVRLSQVLHAHGWSGCAMIGQTQKDKGLIAVRKVCVHLICVYCH